MARWKPDARNRLEQAALELYSARGFEQTTVAEIAAQAGLTERTFFRHFADKREVLFGGARALEDLLVARVAAAPGDATPLDAVAAALGAAEAVFPERRERSRQRQGVIAANPELRERELSKLEALATALAGALRGRGVPDPAAGLAADMGIAVFRAAFADWLEETDRRSFHDLVQAALGELRAVTASLGPDRT